MKIDVSDLIGKPYLDNGRSVRGYDCYGLVVEVCRRYGHTMPDYKYEKSYLRNFWDNTADGLEQLEGKYIKLEENTKLEEGDVLTFMTPQQNIVHMGVMVNNTHFIHCDKNGTHIERLDTYFRKNWEAYRWL